MSYAEGTSVSVEKSRAEIESILRKYGADQFVSGWSENQSVIGFRAHGRLLRFTLPIPDRADPRFTRHPRSSWRERSQTQALAAWEQECRRRWRALALAIKAKLEAVQSEIATFEEEFLANIVLPDGQTVGDAVAAPIAEAYRTGRLPPLLPAIGAAP